METMASIRPLADDEVDLVSGAQSVIVGPLVVGPTINVSVKNQIATVVVGLAIAANFGSGTASLVIVGIGGNTYTSFKF